jgi:hypothetical protein
MNTNLPKVRVNRGNIGNDIWVRLPDLSSFQKTYLSGDEASGQTTLSVLKGSDFSANNYVIIGIPGTEQAEIRKISSVSATTIVISAATSYDHNQGTIITFIPFNQFELYSASSSGGSFSLLSTTDIRPDSLETYINRPSDANTVYYKIRFKNENDTTYSDYSDEVSGTGFSFDTVYSVKKRALDQLGEIIGGILTDEYLDDSLWEARREFDKQFKRWSFRTSFDYDAGNLVEGQYSVSAPSTLRNPDSPQNILEIRIGSEGQPIDYLSKREFNRIQEGIIHTTVATQPSVGQTTLVLTNVRDLADSGSVQVGVDTITYTSKTNSTNTLNGVPASGYGSITVAHSVGVDVWQNASYGKPRFYTIYENTIFFDCPCDSDLEGDNVFMDFYRTLPDKDSDADVLDEPDPDMFVSFLKFKIKSRLTKGKTQPDTDSDYKEYLLRRNACMKKEFIHQKVSFSPDISHLTDVD